MKENKIILPDEITPALSPNIRDLVVIGLPKMGKGTIFAEFTKEYNGIILDLEKGGYDYLAARKISAYPKQSTSLEEAYYNYISIRNTLLENKLKYDYLLIDGLSDLDIFSEIGGTLMYMNSIVGKKFNKKPDGTECSFSDKEFRLVTTLPDGAGYFWTRKWFLEQIEIFKQISPYRIYAAHVADKYIKENDREEVVGSEIALTGKLKTIFASKVTALAKLTADKNKRFLNFEVANESIIAGSRNPDLFDQILISEKNEKTKEITTYWEKIYPKK